MEFYRRASGTPRCIGILSGSYNPPTRAHLALGGAALAETDEVLFVLPRIQPHKTYEGVGFDERLRLLLKAVESHSRFSVASSDGGLFIDIAREARIAYRDAEIALICGRDAAERITCWDYTGGSTIEEQLREYSLLVAARQGSYLPPENLASRIRPLNLSAEYGWYSSTEVRQRITSGTEWENLVPPSIAREVARLYMR